MDPSAAPIPCTVAAVRAFVRTGLDSKHALYVSKSDASAQGFPGDDGDRNSAERIEESDVERRRILPRRSFTADDEDE